MLEADCCVIRAIRKPQEIQLTTLPVRLSPGPKQIPDAFSEAICSPGHLEQVGAQGLA